MYGGFNQIGRTGLLVDEAACNQALSAIYPNEKIESYFLLTFLNHKVDDWKTLQLVAVKIRILRKGCISFSR